MLDRCAQRVLLRCLACLLMTTVVNADGRVFVMDLRNSSGLRGFRDAERACASQHARLASAEELRHSVAECFFSSCTRGWLHGGAVGTTVCDAVGGALKAVDVRTQNATDDSANLDAFCIKDDDAPCGDPPSFPNARLQGHTGLEMGDELLYACVPGHVMPRGHSTFSLLCDSCGEWYGLVQMCVEDGSEVHVDYEDRFPDSHEEAEEESEEQEVRGEVVDVEGATEGKVKDVQDFTGRPTWQQESREAPAATEAPVSLLSQKHMFWFPSEAFQEAGLPVSTNQGTQNAQRASGAQSEESKEHESHERRQRPVDGDDRDRYDDRDADDRDDHNDSRQDEDDHDSRQDEDDHDDHVEHHVPAQHDDLNSQERDDQDDDDKHESHEDHDDITDHHDEDDDDDDDDDHDDDRTHVDHASEEHLDHDDHDHDLDESDTDHDHREPDDHDSYDDLDSHEYDDDDHRRVIFSIATDRSRNATQKKAAEKATTDETWLDGYPVVPEETGSDDSAMRGLRPELRHRGSALRSTDRPNEVELRKPDPLARESASPTAESGLDGAMQDMWGSFVPTAAPSPDQLQPSDPDLLDYDTQETPTDSRLGELTQHPFLSHDPAPPVHSNDVLAGGVMEEHTMHSLPGEAGERGEVEGERGETICAGESCPPRAFGRGPKVAAIIVAVLAVATAILAGVWCYRRQQQKSSVYEMNGKSPSQSRPGQQMEMQQKV